jgi:3-deoxy-7-phosphoheptulonate synthase
MEIAERVKDAGAEALRGGTFKPRTTPYSFGGLEESGLRYLAEAREATGLPIVTEAMDERQLDLVAEHADVVQIGSRNMHNFPLLFKAGNHPSGKPILLKRGFGATIDEFLGAAEYVLLGRIAADADEPGLILCERGIRTFEVATRFTLDVAAIPVIKERSRLPVISDPSHAAGDRKYVNALGLASMAAGADGLLVEVHCNPDQAWCDAAQGLEFDDFRRLMEGTRGIASLGLSEFTRC